MFKRKDTKEIKQVDMGKYMNTLPKEDLEKSQKMKTIFMLLSTLFFAISLFLPVEGRTRVSDIVWLSTIYVMYDIILIVLSVYVSYQGFKRHKIREEVPYQDAPSGFKTHTYFSFEVFNVLHILLLITESAVAFARIEVWGIVNIFVVALSAAFSISARQYLYRANSKTMTFCPPILPEQDVDARVEEENADADTLKANKNDKDDDKNEKT